MFASPSTESLLLSLTQYPMPVKFVFTYVIGTYGEDFSFF